MTLELEDGSQATAIVSIVQTQLKGNYEDLKEGNKITLKGNKVINLNGTHYIPEIVEIN